MTVNAPLSLREYLDALADLGDVVEIDRPVDPDLEAAAIARRSFEDYAPAPLMNSIAGHDGFRILGGVAPFSSVPGAPYARLALALGMDARTPATEIVARLSATLDKEMIPATIVDSGPCQTNVMTGDDVDLEALPLPMLHLGDGGRYFNSIGTVIAKTPDGEWTNWHIARVMAMNGREMNIWSAPVQHFGMIHRMWKKLGKPMPVALVQGPEPAITSVAGMPIPRGVDEVGFLGAWFGRPLELVQCKTIDLAVPATSEIVIEGHLSVDRKTMEGPFGEYHGYLAPDAHPQPVCEISAITYRDDAILPITPAGKPVDDDHTLVGVGGGAEFLHALREVGLPVTSALLLPDAAVHLGVVTVPRDWRKQSGVASSQELCMRIAETLLKTKNHVWMTRLMIFDDDIDPANVRDVVWAFGSRCHPKHGVQVIEERLASPLTPAYTDEERKKIQGPLAIHDCLLADDESRPVISSFSGIYPAEIQQRVLDAERALAD